MIALSVAGMLAMGLPALALHLFSIALTKALRSYSRSLLQERCEARGHPERADAVAHLGQRTERSAEALAVVTGLLLAALVGVGIGELGSPPRVEWVILLVLAIGLLGYVIAGVIVWAWTIGFYACIYGFSLIALSLRLRSHSDSHTPPMTQRTV